jgi:hypothetical protein
MSTVYTPFIEAEDIGGGADVSYTASSARSAALAPGRYEISSTTDCHVARGDAEVAAVADATCYSLAATRTVPAHFIVTAEDAGVRDQVAAIRSSQDGTLRIRRISR